jgi:hypothetical protein
MTRGPVPSSRPEAAAATAAASRASLAQSTRGGSAWRRYLPGAFGIAYVAAWAAGLAAWPVNLALNATPSRVAASHGAHPAEAALQYLLVEGLAGLLLGAVLAAALISPRRGWTIGRTGAIALGALAVSVSVAQCVIGLLLTAAATSHEISRSGALFDVVNRLDGVKMLALACVAVLTARTKPRGELRRWLRAVSVLLAAALAASGYAYLSLTNALAWTAFISGPLLLLWVAAMGITMTTRRRDAAAARAPLANSV